MGNLCNVWYDYYLSIKHERMISTLIKTANFPHLQAHWQYQISDYSVAGEKVNKNQTSLRQYVVHQTKTLRQALSCKWLHILTIIIVPRSVIFTNKQRFLAFTMTERSRAALHSAALKLNLICVIWHQYIALLLSLYFSGIFVGLTEAYISDPRVTTVIYFTLSSNFQENEGVVRNCLEEFNEKCENPAHR